MAKMTRNQKLVIGGVVVGGVVLAIVLATRKASAGGREEKDNGNGGGKKGGMFTPLLPGGYEHEGLMLAPILKETGKIPTKPTSNQQTGPTDPLTQQGWDWGFIGGVNPDDAYAIGEEIAPNTLPFSRDAVTAITPLTAILHAFYVGQGEALVQGYYLIGPLKGGYGFGAGSWGVVEVWNPAWHGY